MKSRRTLIRDVVEALLREPREVLLADVRRRAQEGDIAGLLLRSGIVEAHRLDATQEYAKTIDAGELDLDRLVRPLASLLIGTDRQGEVEAVSYSSGVSAPTLHFSGSASALPLYFFGTTDSVATGHIELSNLATSWFGNLATARLEYTGQFVGLWEKGVSVELCTSSGKPIAEGLGEYLKSQGAHKTEKTRLSLVAKSDSDRTATEFDASRDDPWAA